MGEEQGIKGTYHTFSGSKLLRGEGIKRQLVNSDGV